MSKAIESEVRKPESDDAMNRGPFKMNTAQKVASYIALIVLCIPAIMPFLWMLSTSLKSTEQIFSNTGTVGLQTFLPSPVRFDNYPRALSSIPFATRLLPMVLPESNSKAARRSSIS
jgi:ABC-type glycerol-3-phosphate transport system permease component